MTWLSSQALRHAVRITLAALLAFAATKALALPQGYWAVITAIVVMQASLGATLGAITDRLAGTLSGAAIAAVWVLVRAYVAIPETLIIVLAVAPAALLAAISTQFRLTPITAALVLMGAPPGSGMLVAGHRALEIAVGCLVGALTARFLLPDRAGGAGRIGRGASHARRRTDHRGAGGDRAPALGRSADGECG